MSKRELKEALVVSVRPFTTCLLCGAIFMDDPDGSNMVDHFVEKHGYKESG